MDRKSILHITLMVMVLSLALGAVSAEDVADNADALTVADDSSSTDVTATGEEDVSKKLPVSDLAVSVEALNETDDSTYWNVVVTNNGGDTAYVLVYIDYTDNMAVTYCAPSAGDYLVEFGVWDVGDVAPNTFEKVFIEAPKLDEGPYFLNALTIAEDYNAYDPILGNNYDSAFFGENPGNDYNAAEGAIMPISNLAVDVKALNETDDSIYWSVVVTNKGPESADTTLVFIDYSNNLEVSSYEHDAGDYLVEYGVWNVGSVPVNESRQLLIVTKKIGAGQYYLEALTIAEDSYNTNLGKNYDIEVLGKNPENNTDFDKASTAKETLPATGNPIAIALLALSAVGIGGLKRRF